MPTHPPSPSLYLAAALLAGGKATRLGGRAKGLIQLPDGRTIIERLLAEVRAAGISEVIICANDPETYRFLRLPIVPDLHPGLGPLAGIEAAVRHFGPRIDGLLLLPTDLPYLSARHLRALLTAYRRAVVRLSARDLPPLTPSQPPPVVLATVASPSGARVSPLPALAPPAPLAPLLDRAIAAGNLRVRRLWDHFETITVPLADPTSLTNINTPEDLARLLEPPDPDPDLP